MVREGHECSSAELLVRTVGQECDKLKSFERGDRSTFGWSQLSLGGGCPLDNLGLEDHMLVNMALFGCDLYNHL